jgi:hypothetical protein
MTVCDFQTIVALPHSQASVLFSYRLDNWDLSQYIEVAFALNIIPESTAAQARLAKDFRNLIHPGREKRTKMRCDPGSSN